MNETKRRIPRATFLVLAGLLLSCGESTQMVAHRDGGAGICDGVDCSGHGQCAVTTGDTAVCICEVGYHSDGLECVENVVGEECSGVTCSGHGICVVVRGEPDYPYCVCDQGYRNAGDTNCVPGGGVTCGPGTHEEDGQCVPDPIASGTQLAQESVRGFWISPDEQWVVAAVTDPTDSALTELWSYNVSDGAPTYLDQCNAFSSVLVSSASDNVIYTRDGSVWVVPTTGGAPMSIGSGVALSISSADTVVIFHNGTLVAAPLTGGAHVLLADDIDASWDLLYQTGLQTASPDGSTLYYLTKRGIADGALKSVTMQGTNATVLVSNLSSHGPLVVNGSGLHVVYPDDSVASESQIKSVLASGGTPVTLGLASGPIINRFSVSPNGEHVAIYDNTETLTVVSVSGGAPVNVITGVCSRPNVFSPDSSRLVFIRAETGACHAVPTTGGTAVVLPLPPDQAGAPLISGRASFLANGQLAFFADPALLLIGNTPHSLGKLMLLDAIDGTGQPTTIAGHGECGDMPMLPKLAGGHLVYALFDYDFVYFDWGPNNGLWITELTP